MQSVFVINKSGGLIYHKQKENGHPKLSSNEYLVLAGMLHGINAIAARLQGKSSGIQELETESFKLQCLSTLSGLKFLITCNPSYEKGQIQLDTLYQIYADYAMKNPFYNPEMPIRSELFDSAVSVVLGK